MGAGHGHAGRKVVYWGKESGSLKRAAALRGGNVMELAALTTERRNPATMRIDEMDTLEMLRVINSEDKKVAEAVAATLPDVARAVDCIAGRLACGGRLFYLGAGTSGRLGVLDASECPPTYGTEPDMVHGIIAGGTPAMFRAQEGAEDDPGLAAADLMERGFSAGDVLVGIAASGRTPYVVGGLRYARGLGAHTIAVSCTEGSEIAGIAEIAITPVTGPEAVTGSTRKKAGTAQKLVLNMLSTGAMIRLGKVYGNLMVDVVATNKKLEDRARRIVMDACGCTAEEAASALGRAGGSAKLAILMQLAGCSPEAGRAMLEGSGGRLSDALAKSGI